ncbi:MAG: hypothetical protein P8188_17285, partial [Gemmatimonadota bacterium]
KGFRFPYARLRVSPGPRESIRDVEVEPELGDEAFTYRLTDGRGDTIHLDAVLDYNRDPDDMHGLLLHRLTVEALDALEETGMSKRELIRALDTSPAQLYRLLDPTNRSKSIGQMMALLHLLGRRVEVTVEAASE